nr:transposase [Leisingera sp.]
MGWVTMSERELNRVEVLAQIDDGRLTVDNAANLLDLTRRQVFRLLKRYRQDGAVAIRHKARGKPPNNRIHRAKREYALSLIKENYPDFGPTLAAEMLAAHHGFKVSRETLRKWMAEDGLWLSRKQRRQFHQPRLRRECFGELIQIDGSDHRWFEDRAPPCTLLVFIPEAERFHRSSRTDWFLAFLEKYPSPHMISAMSRQAFIADAWQVVGRKVAKERLLSDIYATAAGSVGLPVGPDSDAVRMFRLVLAEGRSLIRQRDEIEVRSVELLSGLPDYQLLTTIPGIGPINAMTILAEAGDLRRFRHQRQFLKFCGMDLAAVQSGMFRGQSKISKYDNARLRRTLWMAGQTAALKRTNSFRDKFERYISKERHNAHLRRKAYTAIAAKMARTVHAVVKHGEPYRPFFEG